jgi:predicted histidine transporter YuiF (NhaC family)
MRKMMEQPFFKMFAKKRKNRGAIWASLVGLGLSAAVIGVTKGRGKIPIQNIAKNLTSKNNSNRMDNAGLTEFSEDLLKSALNKNHKQ